MSKINDSIIKTLQERIAEWMKVKKAEIYAEFEKRLASVFPEGFKIDSFEFGLDSSKH